MLLFCPSYGSLTRVKKSHVWFWQALRQQPCLAVDRLTGAQNAVTAAAWPHGGMASPGGSADALLDGHRLSLRARVAQSHIMLTACVG